MSLHVRFEVVRKGLTVYLLFVGEPLSFSGYSSFYDARAACNDADDGTVSWGLSTLGT